MRTQIRKERGFTLVELLVVIAIIALLAAILFPVFAKAQAKAKQTQCLSNIRELTTAMMMFAQDNQNTYPTIVNPVTLGSGNSNNPDFTGSWASQLQSYAGNNKIFTCPMDTNGPGFVSYCFNGLLLNVDGTGIQTSNVTNPVEAGIFVDGSSYKFPEAGVINWQGDGHGPSWNNPSAPVYRHSYNMSFADGHAESIGGSGKNQNSDSFTSPIHDAFVGAAAFGYISNNGAGIVPAIAGLALGQYNASSDSGTFVIGGSTTCAPLWQAAAAGWEAAGGSAPTIACTGSSGWNHAGVDLGGRSSWAAGFTSANALAKDGMAIITSTSTRLSLKNITAQQMGDIFMLANTDGISGSNIVHIYSRCTAAGLDAETWNTPTGPFTDNGSGTAGFLDNFIKANTSYALGYLPDGVGTVAGAINPQGGLEVTTQAPYGTFGNSCPTNFTITTVISSADMLAKVSADPYGIGYCSCGEADPTMVAILPLNLNGVIQKYDRAAVENSTPNDAGTYTLAALPSAAGQWTLTRHIYGKYAGMGTGDATSAQAFLAYAQSTTFQQSVVFNSMFFKP